MAISPKKKNNQKNTALQQNQLARIRVEKLNVLYSDTVHIYSAPHNKVNIMLVLPASYFEMLGKIKQARINQLKGDNAPLYPRLLRAQEYPLAVVAFRLYMNAVCASDKPPCHVHGSYIHADMHASKYRKPGRQTAATTSHHHPPVAPAAVAMATGPSCPTLWRKEMGKWKYSLRSWGFPPQGCAHYGCLVSPFPSLAMSRVVLPFLLLT